MSLKHRAGVLAILLVVLPGIAWGDDDEGFSHSGFYVGVGGSYVTDTFEDVLSDALGVSTDIKESWGVNAVLGYRILPFLAAEFEYEWIDEFDIKALGTTVASIETQAFTANLKWIVPTWRIQPYLLTGIGVARFKLTDKVNPPPLKVSETTTDFAGRLGAGVDVYLTKHILLTVGASAVLTAIDFGPSGNEVDNIFYVGGQAGIQYRF